MEHESSPQQADAEERLERARSLIAHGQAEEAITAYQWTLTFYLPMTALSFYF